MPPASDETTLDAASRPEAPVPAAEDPSLGRRIGPYRLERLIARGGMGRVYLAVREDDYEQRVALKLVDRGPENLEVLERFVRERQILARLQHPHVARILDGGTTAEALPFFVMEYVDGEPIDRWCDARGLGLRRRLEVFQALCEVVHFAHQNLVVHGDLKPGNILVTPDGLPKLLDFGIARPLDAETTDDARSAEDKSPLTPGYASPEQLLGQPVTTASDVYSLGVLLYRLVSGRHPFAARPAEPARRARETPPPPSAAAVGRRARRLAGEIDAIVLKALHPDPERRYASTLQLAGDLQRHLAHLPVEALPGTGWQRARKAARRHRLALAALVAIVAFGATTTALWRRSVHEERRAQAARRQAEAAQLRAEKVSGFLEDLFESADPDAGRLTAREILDRGRDRLTRELEDEPEVRAELLGTLGTVYNNLSLFQEARELKEEALRDRLAADPSDRHDLAADLNNLGRLLYDLGDYGDAEGRFRDAAAMWQRLGDELDAVVALRNLAAVLTHSRRTDEALDLDRHIVEVQRRRLGPRDVEVGRSLHSLGVLHRARSENEAAEECLRQALEILEENLGSRHTQVAAAASTLGRVLHAEGRYGEARAFLERALALRFDLLGDDHVEVAYTRKNLAALLLDQGEAEAAGALLEQALATLRRDKPAGDWTIADAESVGGSVQVARGAYAEAEPRLLAAYRTIRAAKGDADVDTVNARERVARLYEAWGRNDEAAAWRAAAVEE